MDVETKDGKKDKIYFVNPVVLFKTENKIEEQKEASIILILIKEGINK
jgi:hypothetical protein